MRKTARVPKSKTGTHAVVATALCVVFAALLLPLDYTLANFAGAVNIKRNAGGFS